MAKKIMRQNTLPYNHDRKLEDFKKELVLEEKKHE